MTVDIDFILRHPTPANALMGDKIRLETKVGIFYDKDGNSVMTIGNNKEEMTKNASTDKSEPSREDLR